MTTAPSRLLAVIAASAGLLLSLPAAHAFNPQPDPPAKFKLKVQSLSSQPIRHGDKSKKLKIRTLGSPVFVEDPNQRTGGNPVFVEDPDLRKRVSPFFVEDPNLRKRVSPVFVEDPDQRKRNIFGGGLLEGGGGFSSSSPAATGSPSPLAGGATRR